MSSSNTADKLLIEGYLTPALLRQLGSNLYDKRKAAAFEVTLIVKEFLEAHENNYDDDAKTRIMHLISLLSNDFVRSRNPNQRKGGLTALAGVALGLSTNSATNPENSNYLITDRDYISLLVPTILASFDDKDSQVCYFACESLYNIVRFCREGILEDLFPTVFEYSLKLYDHTDTEVVKGAAFLNRLLQDVVTGSETFNIQIFLKEVHTILNVIDNRYGGTYIGLVEWILVVNAVPEFNLIDYLPKFLGQLFDVLNIKFDNQFKQEFSIINVKNHVDLKPSTYNSSITAETTTTITVNQELGIAFNNQTDNTNSENNIHVNRNIADNSNNTIDHNKAVIADNNSHNKNNNVVATALASSIKTTLIFTKMNVVHRNVCEALDFLLEQLESTEISSYCPLVKILASQISGQFDNRLPRFIALKWLASFIKSSRHRLADLYPILLESIMHCMRCSARNVFSVHTDSHSTSPVTSAEDAKTVKNVGTKPRDLLSLNEARHEFALSQQASSNMIEIVQNSSHDHSFMDLFYTLMAQFVVPVNMDHYVTRLETLRWVHMLVLCCPDLIIASVNELIPPHLVALADPIDEVVTAAIQVLSAVANYSECFLLVIQQIVDVFLTDITLLQRRGALVLRSLSTFMAKDEEIYLTISRQLYKVGATGKYDVNSIAAFVQLLNFILITAPELKILRQKIRKEYALFKELFLSWSYNHISSFSLCLMSGKYYLGSQIIEYMDSENTSVGSLLQAERLADFLDSSPFLHTRLKLLGADEDDNEVDDTSNNDKDHNNEDDHSCDGTESHLLRCLHGLLSLLQASSTRRRLSDRVRLHGLAFCNTRSSSDSGDSDNRNITYGSSVFTSTNSIGLDSKNVDNAYELIEHFESIQSKYHT